MVHKGKRKQKKPTKGVIAKILVRCGGVSYKFPIKASADLRRNELTIIELQNELENIYNAYLTELSNRFLKASSTFSASYEVKEFVYQLDLVKIIDLRGKVKRILKNECIKLIFNIFYITIHKFLADIRKEIGLCVEKNQECTVFYLAEVLNALECSAKELGKVTENLAEHQEIETNCENITKIAFFEEVLKDFEGVLLSSLEGNKDSIVQNIVNLLIELKKSKSNTNSSDTGSNSSDLSQKSIEEIMCFISGDAKKSPRKKQAKNLEANKFLDTEIEEFQAVLNNFEANTVKLKPNLSKDWIYSLKQKLQNAKSS